MGATVMVSGRLGGDPEVKQVGGSMVLEFSLAEQVDRDTSRWWRVSVWGKRGEVLHEHGLLFKGRHVSVVGELRRVEAYSGKNGLGVGLDISAHSVDIGPRQERDGQPQGQRGGSQSSSGRSNGNGSGGGWGGGGGGSQSSGNGGWGSGGGGGNGGWGDPGPGRRGGERPGSDAPGDDPIPFGPVMGEVL